MNLSISSLLATQIKKMPKAITYILIFVILLLVYVKYLERKSVFFPDKNIYCTPESINLAFEDVYVVTVDNVKINGWFVASPGAARTVLFCHGNAGNIQDRLDKINLLYSLGLNIFIIDYRGYGRSAGEPCEKGIYLDAQAGYDYLVNTRKIKPESIILFGESLGTAVAIDLASKVRIGGLIVEGSFSKGRDMAARIYPFLPSLLFADSYNSLAKIDKVKAPKLFIHSRDDEIVPVELATKLFSAAKEPKHFTEITGGHNNAFLDSRDIFISSIRSFIKEL